MVRNTSFPVTDPYLDAPDGAIVDGYERHRSTWEKLMPEDIEQRLREARNAYYKDGTSPLTDAEYNALEDELRAVDPDNPLLKEVGADTESGWPKAKHEIPMGSLSKVQNKDQFKVWSETTRPADGYIPPVIVSEKLDGISIAIYYEEGKYKQAITRGDGNEGEDITPNVAKMKNVPSQLPIKFTGWLRGEILLFKEDWKTHMSDKKNPRNAAAGTSKRHDGKGCEHLTVLYYDMTDSGTYTSNRLMVKYGIIIFIKNDLCLDIANVIGPVMPHEVPNIVESWEQNREDLPYEIDGMVVEVNERHIFYDMGGVDNRPKGAVAYKFKPIEKTTRVKDVIWQIGRTGRVTPVAELEPVDIGGVTISRASLHTARMALDIQAGPGALVVISRRNDVIPYVERVIEAQPVSMPEFPHKWDGEYLVHTEMDSKTELYNSIKTWVQRLRILHWGDALIKLIIDYELAHSLSDLYSLDWHFLGELAGHGIAKRAKKSLEEKGNNISFADFVSALNIRYCDTLAKNLVAAGFNTTYKLLKADIQSLSQAEGIGGTKATHIFQSLQKKEFLIERLDSIITFEEKGGPLAGLSFCFTGAMSRPRKELENMALDAGAEIKKSVSAGLTHLVLADPSSTTIKAQKAHKLGIKCVGESEFKKICK